MRYVKAYPSFLRVIEPGVKEVVAGRKPSYAGLALVVIGY